MMAHSPWPARGLYLITPDEPDTGRLLRQLAAVLPCRPALVQYRSKHADASLRRAQADALLALCRAHEVPLVINDDVALACAIAADGVHLGREDGAPPPVDLAHERKAGDFVRALIRDGLATACHDLSDGGLAVALAEMAMAAGIGATVNRPDGADPAATFFGEDQGRYLVTLSRADVERFLEEIAPGSGVSAVWIGTTGGPSLKLGEARAISVAELKAAHEGWFAGFMGN